MGAAQSTRVLTAAAVKNATKNTTTTTIDTTTLQNLKIIGQVNVQSPASIQRVSVTLSSIITPLSAQKQSQITNVENVDINTIDSFRLSQLFDARKVAKSTTTTEGHLVERLATRYNSPSIGREFTIALPDGDRRLYREAIWVGATKPDLQ